MVSRGQIYFASLDPVQGREQAGRRPVLVVSADRINRLPLVVTVISGTDARNVPKDHPTNVRVTVQESGLRADTVFLCFQLRSIDPGRLVDPRTGRTSPAGMVSPARMTEVDQALKLVLSLK